MMSGGAPPVAGANPGENHPQAGRASSSMARRLSHGFQARGENTNHAITPRSMRNGSKAGSICSSWVVMRILPLPVAERATPTWRRSSRLCFLCPRSGDSHRSFVETQNSLVISRLKVRPDSRFCWLLAMNPPEASGGSRSKTLFTVKRSLVSFSQRFSVLKA